MNGSLSADKVLQTIGGVLLTVCLALAGYGLRTAVENSERLARIEANRFSVADGAELWREIAKIRETIAKMPASDDPPEWFVRRVEKLEASLLEISRELQRLREDR